MKRVFSKVLGLALLLSAQLLYAEDDADQSNEHDCIIYGGHYAMRSNVEEDDQDDGDQPRPDSFHHH